MDLRQLRQANIRFDAFAFNLLAAIFKRIQPALSIFAVPFFAEKPLAHGLRLKAKLNDILVKHTGQNLKKIEKDTDRDFFMSAAESRDYGLVDDVVKSRRDVEKKPEKVS